MKPERDELSIALEGLRDHPLVAQSREYALRWEKSGSRSASLGGKARWALAMVGACLFAWVAVKVAPGLSGSSSERMIETGIGERRAVVLGDNSRLVLDSNSRVRVSFTGTARDLDLLEGQVHFEVARDARRPFRVRTTAAEILVVGTAFDVVALPTRTTVTLLQGRVNVRAPRAGAEVRSLDPGQQLGIAADGRLLEARAIKLESATAWQRGTVVIDDLPLSEALAIINRYSTQRIVVLGSSLQARKVSGVFRSGDVATEAIVLEKYFGLKEVSRSERAIVLERE